MTAILNCIGSLSQRQILVLVFVLAFVVRLGFLATKPYAWTHKLQAGDEPLYHGLAVNLLKGQGYSFEGEPRSYPPPLYASFVAAVYRLVGISPPAARVGNALLGSLLCILVVWWAIKLWGNKAGLLTGFVAAIYYPFVQLPTYLMTENLYLPVFVAAVMISWQLSGSLPLVNRWSQALIAGALWGLSALTREIAKPVALLVLLWLVVRKRWKEAFIMAIAIVLVGLPWSVRNRIVFNNQSQQVPSNYVPPRTPLFVQFLPGGLLYMSFGPSGNEPKILGHWNWGSDVQRPQIPKKLSPAERDQWLRNKAWEHIKSDPMEAVIKRIPRKLANLLTPFYGTASLPNKVLSTLCYLALLLLSIPAIVFSWKSNNQVERTFVELVLLTVLFTVTFHATFFGVLRYRYPIDALLLVAVGRWTQDQKA
ncbi:Dolichyl-phosphate-mannose-protein mannosyltransferase [Candidatus Fervidibacteria bacterium JGI MDM2 JNZ-1-D12]